MRYSVPIVLLFLWADPVTWAKIKIEIEVKLKLKFAYIWLTYRWLLKVTNTHASRSSSVRVSACTVPDCQTWSVYRAMAWVLTNQTRTVRVAPYIFILDVFCSVRQSLYSCVTSSVHLPVLGISLHHFHPKSLCFGMQQHQYSLSEKTCSS